MRTFLILTVLTALAAANKRYDGYQLFNVYPENKQQVDFVREMQGDDELDFWYEGKDKHDILVPPHKVSGFKHQLDLHQIAYNVAVSNIQTGIDEEVARMAQRVRKDGQPVDYDNFNTYEDIMDELDSLAARCPASYMCETFVVGTSVEGREIKGLRVYSGSGRPAMWIDATTHAREWLSTATLLKIMKHIVDDASDAEVADLLATYDWWFVPVMNPDGYVYSHTNERLWRKSRNVNSGSSCRGTDLNRNYEEEWANAGSSNSPCSDTYHGSSAASEPEVESAQDALLARGSNIVLAIHFHTYGQLWLQPWGSTTVGGSCKYATDHDEMMVVSNAAADAIENTFNTRWERGNSCDTIYPAAGITMDFTKARAGVKYAFTPELRGNSFIVNADQIQPSYEEVWNGLTAAITAIENSAK